MSMPCSLGKKHRWEWVRDVTNKQIHMSMRGTTVKLSRRGEFKCACGAKRLGIAKTGL